MGPPFETSQFRSVLFQRSKITGEVKRKLSVLHLRGREVHSSNGFFFNTLMSQWVYFPWEFRSLFPEESQLRQSYYPTSINYWPSVWYFCVAKALAVRPTLLWQMDMGSVTCVHIWVCAIHMKGRGVRCKQVCTRVDSEGQKDCLTLPRQWLEPRIFRFEFRHTNHWATSPVFLPLCSWRRAKTPSLL